MKAINYIETALAIEMLAYHDKNYLDRTIACSDKKRSETMQELLKIAVKKLEVERDG